MLRQGLTIPSLLLLSLVISATYFAVSWFEDPKAFPIRTVRVEGAMRFLSATKLQMQVEPFVTGGFFTVDMGKIDSILGQQSWLKSFSIRRIWPDMLRIAVEEKKPVVRWNTETVLDESGTVIRLAEANEAEVKALLTVLPVLRGPDSARDDIFQAYQTYTELLRTVGLHVKRLEVSSRNAIDVELNNGLLIRLGKSGQHERIARFVKMYPLVQRHYQGLQQQINIVDLRYTNGLAVTAAPA